MSKLEDLWAVDKSPSRSPTYRKRSVSLGLDSPFFSTIVLFKNQPFPRVLSGFLERRIPGRMGKLPLE